MTRASKPLQRRIPRLPAAALLPALPFSGSLPPCASVLRRFCSLLGCEALLLARLVYRGHNQHRRHRWWASVQAVKRIVGRLRAEVEPARKAFEAAMCAACRAPSCIVSE